MARLSVLVPGTGHFADSWALQCEAMGVRALRTIAERIDRRGLLAQPAAFAAGVLEGLRFRADQLAQELVQEATAVRRRSRRKLVHIRTRLQRSCPGLV